MELFTSSDDDILIDIVSQHRFLYDTSSPMFRNAFKRLKAWDEIGVRMNKSGKGCKSRWKNIKDTYFRQKRKLTTGQSAGGHPRSKFESYHKKLSFLEAVYNPAQDRSSFKITVANNDENSNSTIDSEAQSSEYPEDIIVLKEECDSDENDVTEIRVEDSNTDADQWDFAGYKSSTETTETQGQKSIAKRKLMQDRRRRMIMLKNRQKIVPRQRVKNKPGLRKVEDDDEINLFTRQTNSVLRKLPSYHQIKAMQEMFEILTKYKILAAESSSSGHSHRKSSSIDPLNDC